MGGRVASLIADRAGVLPEPVLLPVTERLRRDFSTLFAWRRRQEGSERGVGTAGGSGVASIVMQGSFPPAPVVLFRIRRRFALGVVGAGGRQPRYLNRQGSRNDSRDGPRDAESQLSAQYPTATCTGV